jgi:polysaccharide export outer membrane protein
MYAMQGDGDTTVLKALALSQGLQAYTTSLAYIYRRPVAGGEREEISIPLSRIIARKERDVPLLPDDIFYVPEAKGKRMTAKILSQISGFGQTTATGLLIYK